MTAPMHIVAGTALIKNARDEVLLIRHPQRGWETPGGQVEEGEALLDGVMREIREESGISVAIGPLAGVYSNISAPSRMIFAFLGHYISGDVKTSAESLEVAWVPRAQILDLVTFPPVKDRVQDMLEYSGRLIYRVYKTQPTYHTLETRMLR